MRVTAGGLVPPRKVLVARWLAFGIAVAVGAYLIALVGIAVAVGAYLIALVGWGLLAIGAATRTDGPALNAALARTGMLLAAYSLLLSAEVLLAY